MTRKLNLTILALFIAAITIISCSKNSIKDSPPPQTTMDTLSGKEFVFPDMTWDFWLDDFGELYGRIDNRSDLFFDSTRALDVYVKSITDTTCVIAQKYNDSNLSAGYIYNIYRKGLSVFPHPDIFPSSANAQLEGSKFSLKVRFH